MHVCMCLQLSVCICAASLLVYLYVCIYVWIDTSIFRWMYVCDHYRCSKGNKKTISNKVNVPMKELVKIGKSGK